MEIKLLPCPLCLKPHFKGVESLRSSLIGVATSQLTCPVCNETLMGLDKLTIHLFVHVTEQIEAKNSEREIEDKLQLDVDKYNSEDHQKTSEDNTRTIRCDICNFTFTDKNILEMHQKLLHQTIPDKTTGLYSYHCHLCSKKFKKRGSLMVHLRVAHYGFGHQVDPQIPLKPQENKSQDNKQWECDVCSKMFTTKYFLKKHKRLHTGEMPYFCAQCNKSFTFQQSYHKHMLYHSSEKPYVCTECGRAFKELSTLQNHARIHSGERPFGCETCGKKFRQRVSYLVHQRIHTGVMPYKCTACDKSFRYKVSQRSHKCPMTPPGSVIKIYEDKIPNKSENKEKCIMSVDYDTGNINFIHEHSEAKIFLNNSQLSLGLDVKMTNSVKNETPDICPRAYSESNSDLFSMVLSPLLPDVEALCLNTQNIHKVEEKNENMVLEDSLKEIFYGSDSSNRN